MTGQTVSNAVAKPAATDLVRQYREDFAMVLPRHINADQWVRLTTGLLRRNDKLARVAASNPPSLLAALLDCARLGLEPGDTYHLVPFGSEIVGIPDYTGLIELIYRAGMVRSVKCEIVARADLAPDASDRSILGHRRPRFEWNPSEMDRPHHRPDWFADRTDMVGAYAYAVMLDGSPSQVVMRNKAEIEKVQAVSRTGRDPDGMWMKWPDRAWRKTVLRELSKFVPTSAEFRGDAARALEHVAATRLPVPPPQAIPDGDVIDADTVGESSSENDDGLSQ
jgi:recombination protein RecT